MGHKRSSTSLARLLALTIAATIAASLALSAAAQARSGTGSTAAAFALYAKGDYAAASRLLLPLAESGDARAQALLGFLYQYGQGLPQNFGLAALWYGCAAEQGDPTGQYLLGLLYDKGQGVPRDVVLSQKWLILAAAGASQKQRDTYVRIRDAVATKMSAAQRALAQRLAMEWAAAPPPPGVPR